MAGSAVEGLQVFRQHMQEAEGSYALIGGTACDILLAEAGLSFRATHDFDVVIVAETGSSDGRSHMDLGA